MRRAPQTIGPAIFFILKGEKIMKIQSMTQLPFVTEMDGKKIKYRIKTMCYADCTGKTFGKPFEKVYDAFEPKIFMINLIDTEANKQFIVSIEKID